MKVGIMQPYFFPYIGYWQLIKEVDHFILLDEVQYIRHGWINRNRILKENGGWKYVVLDIKSHPRQEKIRNIEILESVNVIDYLERHLTVYKKIATYYEECLSLIRGIECLGDKRKITDINECVIKAISKYLGIGTTIYKSSDKSFDYSFVSGPGDWALEITRQVGGNEYVNPISGRNLFDKSKFEKNHIKLSFINPLEIRYSQGREQFEPSLSIIDVLMFNGREKTKELLGAYEITG